MLSSLTLEGARVAFEIKGICVILWLGVELKF